MQRPIKFRVWAENVKKMFDGGFDLTYDGKIKATYGIFDKKLTIMQWTGLKDKNGKEIYEGDIVRHYDYPHCKAGGTSIIEWEKDACGFRPFIDDNERYGRPLAGEWIEVIGNIYENKELLDGEK